MRLIYINVAIFLLARVLMLVGFVTGLPFGEWITMWLAVPSKWSLFGFRAWTALTYQFLHIDLWHIFFNMLWLYWLGRIFLEFFNPKQMTALYILGGIAGALLYVACYTLLPGLQSPHSYPLLGASASIMAIVIGVAVYYPDYQLGLFLIGRVSLKWIAVVVVIIDLLSIGDMATNAGGHLAHLGGALTGLAWGLSMKRGHDFTSWFNRLIDGVVALFSRHRHEAKVKKSKANSYNYRSATRNESTSSTSQREARLDAVLDKIKRSGYSALTEEEKSLLFSFSRDKKQ